jgi:chitin-binding protein
VTDVGTTFVSLSWTPAIDDGPFLFYEVWVNGAPHHSTSTALATTVRFLTAETTYTFNVRARDYANQWSPLSAPLVVTTDPVNPNDVTPPTTPTNLHAWEFCEEIHLFWTQSTDDFDPQAVIRYDVYVDGVFSDVLFGSGGPSMNYGDPGETNVFEVFAIDTAGNVSEPAVLILDLCG